MTREEFEYVIKSCGCFIYRGQTYYEESELIKTFEDMGLIEQEPSGDAVSRKALKHKLQEHYDFFVNAYGGFSNLPQNDKARVDEISNCIAMVVNEPSVNPQPTAHWICGLSWKCSKCGYEDDRALGTDFCPHCGRRMVEPQESEDKAYNVEEDSK